MRKFDVNDHSQFVKRVVIAVAFCAVLLFYNTPSKSDDSNIPVHRWELWTGALVDFTYELNSSTLIGNFLGGRTAVLPSIGYLVSDSIELLFAPGFYVHTSGTYTARATAGVGIHFFGRSFQDSFFCKGMVGFDDFLDSKTSDNVNFTLKYLIWSVSVGKKLQINPYFSFSPELNLTQVKENYSVVSSFSIVPLQFGLFF